MPLTPGTRLGPYEITVQIGAGGMGEVYRATDTNLKRQVAIKVLPASVASDRERLARFQREAEILAALNHPNIAHIHGLEKSDGTVALVMELVEGPTLADRIANGAIPIVEALAIAKQIAEALEAAHEQGIIHRDLKPANIKVRDDGVVKVLDFGLAKAIDASGAAAVASMSPTIAWPAMTEAGMILGTAAYMSPEQARGKAVDERTDIWAFGCVVFEMLTRRTAFQGGTLSDTIVSVLEREPDWRALPEATPLAVRRVLTRCLVKDPRSRWQDIGDVRIELSEPLTETAAILPTRGASSITSSWLPWLLTAVVSIGALIAWYAHPRPPPEKELRVEIVTPPTPDGVSLAISPDGTTIAFVAMSNDQPQLWVRSLGSGEAHQLPGTERASYPFWSPDGTSIAFFSDGKLKAIELESGSIRFLTNAVFPSGGTWSRGGTILLAPGAGMPLSRISEQGGDPVPVVRIEAPQQSNHRAPHFLPDDRHFLYYVAGTPDARGVYLGDLGGTAPRRLLDADSTAMYEASGHLLFVRQGKLYGQSFDAARLTLSGIPTLIADGLVVDPVSNTAPVATSSAGPIIYRTGASADARQLVWLSRDGQELGQLGSRLDSGALSPTLSPDGTRAVLYRTIEGNADLWTIDTTRGVLSRLTSSPANELNPIWSADGARIVFGMSQNGAFDIFQKPADRPGGEELLFESPQNKAPLDWSHDGRFLLYRTSQAQSGYDIWAWPLDGHVFPVADSRFDEREGQFSPDGNWVAYESNESGRFEIYVQSFPDRKIKIQVSANGGAQLRWRRDGKELFYVALDGQLMALPVLRASNTAFVTGPPVALFRTHIGGPIPGPQKQQYDVWPDGQKFMMNSLIQGPSPPLSVIFHWSGNNRIL